MSEVNEVTLQDESSTREQQTQVVVEGLAEEACLSLFEAYGVQLERGVFDGAVGGERSLTGIIGFTGRGITGMCLVAASEEPLMASIPVQGSLRDWVAELSNQLAGRLKHKLLAHGAEVYVTTPIVLRSARIEPLPRRKLVPRAFTALGGSVALWVEVEIAEEFELADSAVDLSVAEGETVLF